MTYVRTSKFWLLATGALIFGSHISASAQTAQTYQSGAPTMVAAAPSLPTIPAEQIARDVTAEVNPRTGKRELIAAPFDPFEEDPTLAASLRLRSADGVVAIDGHTLRDGALVELDFYYNSPSDDPYGGRNFGDTAFVNGELAPVVMRDTRILECSTRVDNVVYDHSSYYGIGYSGGIYRPYRHYAGHAAFGFGFGNSYYGPGFGFYGSSRSSANRISFGNRGVSRSRARTNRAISTRSIRDRNSDRRDRNRNVDRDRDRDDNSRTRRTRNGEAVRNQNNDAARRRENVRRLNDREVESRARSVRSFGVGRNRDEVRRNARNSGVGSGVDRQPRAGNAPAESRSSATRATQSQSRNTETRRNETRRADARRSDGQRDRSTRSESSRSETRSRNSQRPNSQRSETRRNSSNARSNSSSSSRSNNRPKKVKNSSSRRRISPNDNKRRLNFFPDAGYGGRSVVTSQTVDCAREDKLTVFIPNERLDAARFDGLTLIALDAQGGEAPIYLPPNYIEGFRMAATGRIRPQGSAAGVPASSRQDVTPAVRSTIEAAPCPAGTSKQSNGTCLQTNSYGYPR